MRTVIFVRPVEAVRVARALVLSLLFLPAAGVAQADASDRQGEYIVRAGDQLRIRVWPDAELGGEFPVEDDGKTHLPVLGELQVAGLPLSDLRRELRSRYGDVLKSPTVSVTAVFPVSVLGAVVRPGMYQVTPTQGVIDAVTLAGGFSGNAREHRVRVLRGGEVIQVNAERVLEEGGSDPVGGLQSGDRIIVPRGWSFGVRDVLTSVQLVLLVVSLVGRATGG